MWGAMPVTIAFIGFGEVGQTFSRGFLAREGVAVRAFDVLFGATGGTRLLASAGEIGVAPTGSAAAAASGADVVISAVTADRTEAVATDAAGFLAPGQIYLDVNSAAPETKRRAAAVVGAAGAQYVEAAVMAPVGKPGLAVPILAGGPESGRAAGLLNALGMNLTPVSHEYGKASAMKLCRSIIIKGLEALLVDCAAASARFGVTDDVFASLSQTFPSIDWHSLAPAMAERVTTHGIRRAAEMREAAEMLETLGIQAGLARAVADAQQRGAKPKR